MSYRSIFLHSDWILQRYAGWHLQSEGVGYKVLTKGRLPRQVIVLTELPLSEIGLTFSIGDLLDFRSIVTLKFVAPDVAASGAAELAGLRPTADNRRRFHKFTFVIELGTSTDQLWMAMRPTNRNLCKRAEQAGITVQIEATPTASKIESFFIEYSAMAKERGLAVPELGLLTRMASNGQLLLARSESNGQSTAQALVYLAGNTAMYYYGVNAGKGSDGAGQLLQWEIIRALQQRGLQWYDLGGVPQVDEANGIYKFKKGFGGKAVPLGPELNWTPTWVQLAQGLRTWWQRRIFKIE